MKKYIITFVFKGKKDSKIVEADIFINAYQTFIESYEWHEILCIKKHEV
jgi:hypothetical protein